MIAILDELTNPQIVNIGDDDNLDHLYCVCNPDVSLCGKDISDGEYAAENDPLIEEDLCIVCDDLCEALCPQCGL